jgi:5-methylcytosine-specific restriction protein A
MPEEVKIMPIKPKKPCAYSGCPNLTHERFCEEHKQVDNQFYNRYQRDRSHTKHYDSKWRKISQTYRQTHPLCEICKCNGRLVPAEIVHHIKPLANGGTNAFDNLQSLCSSCHSRLHSKRGERWKKN